MNTNEPRESTAALHGLCLAPTVHAGVMHFCICAANHEGDHRTEITWADKPRESTKMGEPYAWAGEWRYRGTELWHRSRQGPYRWHEDAAAWLDEPGNDDLHEYRIIPLYRAVGWREIASAPRDGRWLLGWWGDDRAESMRWDGRAWSHSDGDSTFSLPTHWQPLNPPIESLSEQTGGER